MNDLLLLSKDILRQDYLSTYGGLAFDTPNIDMLARKGTRFDQFYCAATSSAMSYTCMFTGLNIYEIDRKYYHPVSQFTQGKTLFNKLEDRGYETHVIWDNRWMKGSYRHSMVYDERTKFHPLEIGQPVGPHRSGDILSTRSTTDSPIQPILKETDTILKTRKKPVFLWVHCPHVFLGRPSYGSDIDLFDELAGGLRDYFSDSSIYITSDHGHNNCEKNKRTYGFHVYEGAIKIPLITPNHFNQSIIDTPLNNIQICNILLDKQIKPQEYIYCDTHYYYQPFRRLMIRKDKYKYIFNKINKSEELYDLEMDPHENANLLVGRFFDIDRNKHYNLEEVYYYPHWQEAEAAFHKLRMEKNRIWKEESRLIKYLNLAKMANRSGVFWLRRAFKEYSHTMDGRWGSKVSIRN
jgi:hypothetical protein